MANLALPQQFDDLAPWGEEWCLDTEKARHFKRIRSDRDTVKNFFGAVFPRMDEIIQYLNTKNEIDPRKLSSADRNLYYLAATCIEMSHPIDMNWVSTDIDDKFPSERLEFEEITGR